ncbi:MAG: hypothetical protein VCD66_10770 [Alphaproteobacteria bacterium]|jgi:hypothetical protein
MKQDSRYGGKLYPAGRGPGGGLAVDRELLDELQALLDRLGAAKVLLTLYLVEFGGLPPRLALPLLRETAGSCAMLRPPRRGRHLVIYLGPEPSLEAGGFQGRLLRGLTALTPPSMAGCISGWPWAEVRGLRRCNHDIAAPEYLLLDLSGARPRVLGLADWSQTAPN